MAEADAVAAQIARLRDGGRSLAEVAVLFRINAQSESFEEALSARGVPYVIRGAARFFDLPSAPGGDPPARCRPLRRRSTTASSRRSPRSWAAWAGSRRAPTGRCGQTRDRWESWHALVNQATEFARTPVDGVLPDLNAFVDDLDRRAAEQHAPVADGVTLATFHAAKGLEWDSVFLCGLQDGTLPITHADTPAAIEEERRLLYVGMTRARVDLSLSWSLARNPGGRGSRKPSRFLDPLLPDAVRVTGAQPAQPQDRQPAASAAARSRRVSSVASAFNIL